jgi:hypothetical protein
MESSSDVLRLSSCWACKYNKQQQDNPQVSKGKGGSQTSAS